MSKPITSTLLTKEEIAAIRAEVDKQVLEGKKKAEKERIAKLLLQEARAAENPQEELVMIQIELPPFACASQNGQGADIMIDGVDSYFHGRTYTVKRSRAEGLREIMQGAWRHEEIAFGHRNPMAYFKPHNAAISGGVKF